MRDVLGWRRKFGVLGPSTNTVVQPDFEMMRPRCHQPLQPGFSRPTRSREQTTPSWPARR